MHRPSKSPERISLGMELIAVVVGVSYGVVDRIGGRGHRDADPARPDLASIDLREHRLPAAAGPYHRVTV